MKRVYKYPLEPNDGPGRCVVPMPATSQVLHVAAQGDDLCVWALVDITHTIVDGRTFLVFGTGHDIDPVLAMKLKHVGTGMMDDGLVFHVFEEVWG